VTATSLHRARQIETARNMGAPLFAEQTGNGHDGVSFTHTAGYAFHQSSCPRAPEENGWLTFSKTAAAHAESAARTAVRRSRSVGAPQSASKAVAGTGVRFVIGGERAAQSRAVAKRSFGPHHPKKAPPRVIFGPKHPKIPTQERRRDGSRAREFAKSVHVRTTSSPAQHAARKSTAAGRPRKVSI
jgi:hypothetical protein